MSFSFDDARESQVDHGLPVLDACGFKATFYVTPRSVEKRVEDWKRAAKAGHEIGNHTSTHPCSGNYAFSRGNALEEYTLDRIEADILGASAGIERLLGVTPRTFAYPCGQTFVGRGQDFRSYVPVIAKHFVVGRSAFDEMPNHPSMCDLAHAFAMDADGCSFEKLKNWVDMAVADGGWAIFLAHDVGEEAGHQRISKHTLEQFFRHCMNPASGVWCGTVLEVGEYLRRERGF